MKFSKGDWVKRTGDDNGDVKKGDIVQIENIKGDGTIDIVGKKPRPSTWFNQRFFEKVDKQPHYEIF